MGHTAAQVALNWLRQQEGVAIPIVGATKPAQMAENLECLDFRLTEDQMKQLDDASRIQLGFPHDFSNSKHIRNIIFGETFDLIDR